MKRKLLDLLLCVLVAIILFTFVMLLPGLLNPPESNELLRMKRLQEQFEQRNR